MSAAFTANSTSGSYTVTASAPGVTGTASFSLTNQAASIATTTTITSTSSSFHSFPLPEPDALVDGPPVVVNFTVAQTSGSVAPTGTVVVKDGFGDTCTTTTLNSGAGVCSFTTIPQFWNWDHAVHGSLHSVHRRRVSHEHFESVHRKPCGSFCALCRL